MVKLGAKKTDGLLPPVTEDDTIHMSDFVYLFGDVDRSLLAQGPVFNFYCPIMQFDKTKYWPSDTLTYACPSKLSFERISCCRLSGYMQ